MTRDLEYVRSAVKRLRQDVPSVHSIRLCGCVSYNSEERLLIKAMEQNWRLLCDAAARIGEEEIEEEATASISKAKELLKWVRRD